MSVEGQSGDFNIMSRLCAVRKYQKYQKKKYIFD